MQSPSSVGGSPQLPSFPSNAPAQPKDAEPGEPQSQAPLQGSPAKPGSSKKSARDQELITQAQHAKMVRRFFDLSNQDAPIAKKIPYSTTHHGYVLHDPYHWQRQYPLMKKMKHFRPEIVQQLELEKRHYEKSVAPYQALIAELYEEMKGRIVDEDKAPPVEIETHTYWWEYAPGSQRRRWLRRDATGEVQVLLDEDAEAAGRTNYTLCDYELSPDDEKIVVVSDDNGWGKLTCVVRDIKSGDKLDKFYYRSDHSPIWTSDSCGLFCISQDKQTSLVKVFLRTFRETGVDEQSLYETTCEYDINIYESNNDCIFIETKDHVSNEIHMISQNDPTYTPILIHARKENVKVSIKVSYERLWILTNERHENFELFEASLDDNQTRRCRIKGSDDLYIREIETRHDFLMITARDNKGLDRLFLMDYRSGEMHPINVEEKTQDEAYSVRFKSNTNFFAKTLRIELSSMRTPTTTFEYDPTTKEFRTLKVQQIPSGYNPEDYETKRLLIRSRDDEDIPVSICYNKTKFKKDGTGKIFATAYGTYGEVDSLTFSIEDISLMVREYACVKIHPRGSGDKGPKWGADGLGEKRENAFNDVIDALKGLITLNYAKEGNIALDGESAGGTIVGAVLNEAPEILGTALARAPFVDVLNTLLDEKLPLTQDDWELFGNPIKSKKFFETIFAYSPYNQIRKQDYPPIQVRGGMLDLEVTYWEFLKFVSALREKKTNDNPVILNIDMGGHFEKGGRYDSLMETAENYAFVLITNGNGHPCRQLVKEKNMPQKAEDAEEIVPA